MHQQEYIHTFTNDETSKHIHTQTHTQSFEYCHIHPEGKKSELKQASASLHNKNSSLQLQQSSQ